jgi:hypothetical protein
MASLLGGRHISVGWVILPLERAFSGADMEVPPERTVQLDSETLAKPKSPAISSWSPVNTFSGGVTVRQ